MIENGGGNHHEDGDVDQDGEGLWAADVKRNEIDGELENRHQTSPLTIHNASAVSWNSFLSDLHGT